MNNNVTAACDSTVIVEMLSPLFPQYITHQSIPFPRTETPVSMRGNASIHVGKLEFPAWEREFGT